MRVNLYNDVYGIFFYSMLKGKTFLLIFFTMQKVLGEAWFDEMLNRYY